ncbi:MAG: hypothetical protein HBSAPP03_20360 [Phycisphaerae bacterium]|nr:MAG: hypothetical protein HBSAPP03_20360 [Phycisphaerae bacterium]
MIRAMGVIVLGLVSMPALGADVFSAATLKTMPDQDTPAVRSRAVRVNFDTGGGLPSNPGDELTLNLFDDLTVRGVVTSSRESSGFIVVHGHVPGEAEGEFLLVYGQGVMTGEVRGAGIGSYEVRFASEGVHVVREIDDHGWKPCATDHAHEVDGGGVTGPGGYDDRTPIIRVLVMYTAQAMNAEGSEAAMQSRVVFAINQANTVYVNSQVNAQLELAYMGLVDYVESGNASTDLSRWRSTSDGFMDVVHCMRNQVGADMCALLVNNFNACGIAYLMTNVGPGFATSAFSVTDKDCINGYTFAHELGHNMGCAHDRANAGSAAYPYAYGYRTPDSVYRTVMAYSPGTRVGRFSNPNISYNGYVMGVPIGQTDAAFNAQCITNTAPTIAAFRGAPMNSADVNCDGALNGVDVEIQELAVGGLMADYCNADADFNQDGAVNGLDVEAVELAVGGGWGC